MSQLILYNDWCPVFDPLPEGWVAPVTIIPKGYWERLTMDINCDKVEE